MLAMSASRKMEETLDGQILRRPTRIEGVVSPRRQSARCPQPMPRAERTISSRTRKPGGQHHGAFVTKVGHGKPDPCVPLGWSAGEDGRPRTRDISPPPTRSGCHRWLLPSLSTTRGAASGLKPRSGGFSNPFQQIPKRAAKVLTEARQVAEIYALCPLVIEFRQHVPANAGCASNVDNPNPLLPHQPGEMATDHCRSGLVAIFRLARTLAHAS